MIRNILAILIMLLPLNLFSQTVTEYTVDLYDESRERSIPLAIYSPSQNSTKCKVVIMNHGYDRNRGGAYKDYSTITRKLASKGYFVISIQHELVDDALLAMEGSLYETRMPNWQRGVQNIYFTITEFKELRPDLDWEDVSLIGHSNGGDMAMLFAKEHPQYIKRVISLDHRRMPIPLNNALKLYSLRGCDFEADEGVLPSVEDQQKYSIKIVKFDDIKHGDMDDKGSPAQLERINNFLLQYLED